MIFHYRSDVAAILCDVMVYNKSFIEIVYRETFESAIMFVYKSVFVPFQAPDIGRSIYSHF